MNGGTRCMVAWGGAAFAAVFCCLSATPGSAQNAEGANPYNEALIKLSPDERAAKLAGYIGFDCIGTKPFLMGVTKEGKARGYAYWSIQCAGDKSYMIQIAPDGEAASVDCATFKSAGQGHECYKTF